MSAEIVGMIEIDERADQMFLLRLSGHSVRRIARQFQVSEAVVNAAVQHCVPPISDQMRKNTLELELARLDQMQAVFYPTMLQGNHQSAAICRKIKELRGDYLGIRAASRTDPIALVKAAEPELTTTERISGVLDDLAHNPLKGGKPKAIDGPADPVSVPAGVEPEPAA